MLPLRHIAGYFAALSVATACTRSGGASAKPEGPPGATLVWADEFDGDGLPDSSRWTYDVGAWGWGNNELQHYTMGRRRNARVEGGRLVIEAHRERYDTMDYTSARLVTRGRESWTYGYLQVRARLPSGLGTWPAVWTLGDNISAVGWPRCGEIDIMEHVGYAPDSLYGTVHTDAFNHVEGTQVGKAIHVPDIEDGFHTYAVDWDAERIEWQLDGEVYHRFDRRDGATVAEWPFDAPQHLLINLAVGGNWGGRYGVDTAIWPQRMEVDWVRVWQ